MSWQASQWAVTRTAGSATAKAVLMVLAEASKDGSCTLSHDTIAERAELSRRAVVGAMQALEAAGLISRRRRADLHGHRTSDVITLCLGAADALGQGAPEASGDHGPKCTKQPAYVHLTTRLGAPDAQEPVCEPVSNREERACETQRRPLTRISDGFPDAAAVAEARAYYQHAGWDIDAEREADRFRDWHAKHEKHYRDWSATWRSWYKKATTFADARKIFRPSIDQAPPDDWEHRVAEFKANYWWNETEWGPKPGKPGCAAPVQILAKYGYHVALVAITEGGAR
jgi:lysophospholipase L1-like esterase